MGYMIHYAKREAQRKKSIHSHRSIIGWLRLILKSHRADIQRVQISIEWVETLDFFVSWKGEAKGKSMTEVYDN